MITEDGQGLAAIRKVSTTIGELGFAEELTTEDRSGIRWLRKDGRVLCT